MITMPASNIQIIELDLSFTEENYLKIIYHLHHKNQNVLTNSIAEALETKPSTVSDMLKKLSSKKLVNYEKYKGVSLTQDGQLAALWVIRKHRLWEVFLVEKLKFSWDEVHEVAEQLEHIKSKSLIDKLDQFLGFPKKDPHGDPIPDSEGNIEDVVLIPLSNSTLGKMMQVSTVKSDNKSFLQYLAKVEIKIGSFVKIVERLEYDGSLEIELNNNTRIIISSKISENIMVESI
jgi:DtxR family Mn-dependent transcriptional regulator